MALEIQYRHTTTGADTLYAVVRRAAALAYWDNTNSNWEDVVPAQWTGGTANYSITMTETVEGSYTYDGTFPAAITAGLYNVDVYLRAGANPEMTDTLLASGVMDWDGSSEITGASLALEGNVEGHVTSGLTAQGYTTIRSPFLDELGGTRMPADLDTLISRLTAIRAGWMDNLSNLDATISSRNATVPDAAGVVATALGNLETHGDSAWATATGFATPTNITTATQAAKLAADGLDSVAVTEPSGVASNFREMVVQLWRRFFGKSTLTKTATGTGTLRAYKEDGTTVATTQSVSDDGTTETQGEAS